MNQSPSSALLASLVTLITSITLLALSAAAAGRGERSSVRAGDLDVTLSLDPDPPHTGENQLIVTLADVAGKPVDRAALTFVWQMPAMGSMPEMKGAGRVEARAGGRYAISYPLTMNGDWYLTLSVVAPGHLPQQVKMKVATGRPGVVIEGAGAEPGNVIQVSRERQQLIGVTFGTVERRLLAVTLRVPGRVEMDERNQSDVTLKYEAFVQRLYVGETGGAVRRGQRLATVYSPDLLAAQEELLVARRAGGSASAPLSGSLERRLALWDLSPQQIQESVKAGTADGRVTIVAPVAGIVLEKNVVEGAHVEGGTSLYRIGNLGRVWLQAAVPERDASLVAVGQAARVTIPALPQPLDARVTFVAPSVSEKTRTVAARIELLNPRSALKPGMFADVAVEVPLGMRLAVPDSALLMSGEHRYAFVDRGGGRLQAVEVQIGALAGDHAEVRGGLSAGDRVATGATFLLSSEAKLRDALPQWTPSGAAGAAGAPGPR